MNKRFTKLGRNLLDPDIFYVANEAILQDMPLYLHILRHIRKAGERQTTSDNHCSCSEMGNPQVKNQKVISFAMDWNGAGIRLYAL